jgi:hypothetical protein
MKILPLLCAAILFLTVGCARTYVITLNNGTQYGAKGKPRLENGMYVYKDMQGNENAVSAARVTQVAPASQMPSKKKSKTAH